MPHVHIKHYPVPLSATERAQLFQELTSTITRTFGVAPGTVSIALEPVTPDDWAERVVQPDFVERKELQCQTPDYYAA